MTRARAMAGRTAGRAGAGRRLCAATVAVALVLARTPGAAGRELRVGVNGHDDWTTDTYRQAPVERAFALLERNGFTSYRVDVGADARGRETLRRLVEAGRRHHVVIRPMLYVDDAAPEAVAATAVEFADDIPVWELGNELNLRGVDRFDQGIDRMIAARAGIERAAALTGRPLRTAINVTAFADPTGQGLSPGRDTYPFLDRAIARGLRFDLISFHYYPGADDRADGWMRAYLAPLRKYGKPVIVTETNCGQIYAGDDGDSRACAATVLGLIDAIDAGYDFIDEVILYELYDDPHAAPGPERHFGVLFDIDRPKRIFAALGARAASRRPAR